MIRARAHVVGAILQAGAVFEEPALKEAGFLLAADDRTGICIDGSALSPGRTTQ